MNVAFDSNREQKRDHLPENSKINYKKMSKAIRIVFKIDSLSLCECKDGFWLYDYVLGMNISMRAKTEQDAIIEGFLYYQKRFSKLKKEHEELNKKVEIFVSQFMDQE